MHVGTDIRLCERDIARISVITDYYYAAAVASLSPAVVIMRVRAFIDRSGAAAAAAAAATAAVEIHSPRGYMRISRQLGEFIKSGWDSLEWQQRAVGI